MDFENYSISELRELREKIDNVLSNKQKTTVKEKMEKVRMALQELHQVAPYAFFVDSNEDRFEIQEIIRLSEATLGITLPIRL